MRFILAILAILVLAGCQDRDDRAQAAANADAGLQAAAQVLAPITNDPLLGVNVRAEAAKALAIVAGTAKYLAPAAGVPHVEWPIPKMTPAQIIADPPGYAFLAPPEPKTWGYALLGGLAAAGGVALWAAKILLPLVPGVGGPARALIEAVANVAWHVTATNDQKLADNAKHTVSEAANAVVPVLDAIQNLPAGSLPSHIDAALKNPFIADALAALMNSTTTPKPTHGV
jgi:uncharacterized protein (UPF0147 family)